MESLYWKHAIIKLDYSMSWHFLHTSSSLSTFCCFFTALNLHQNVIAFDLGSDCRKVRFLLFCDLRLWLHIAARRYEYTVLGFNVPTWLLVDISGCEPNDVFVVNLCSLSMYMMNQSDRFLNVWWLFQNLWSLSYWYVYIIVCNASMLSYLKIWGLYPTSLVSF